MSPTLKVSQVLNPRNLIPRQPPLHRNPISRRQVDLQRMVLQFQIAVAMAMLLDMSILMITVGLRFLTTPHRERVGRHTVLAPACHQQDRTPRS
mmetsp:Transcript_22889/g.37671  ORF Transcript_22889/g.37671 Transcript_22889/m.37671 type:complete len:94 (-) Transcript_22889:891-1172(-)